MRLQNWQNNGNIDLLAVKPWWRWVTIPGFALLALGQSGDSCDEIGAVRTILNKLVVVVPLAGKQLCIVVVCRHCVARVSN
jgi:hypothetical protein